MFEESVRERTGAESCCYDLRFLSPCIKSHRLKIWEIQVTVLFTENKVGPYRVHGIFMPGVTQLFVFPFVNAAQFSTCTFLKPSTFWEYVSAFILTQPAHAWNYSNVRG